MQLFHCSLLDAEFRNDQYGTNVGVTTWAHFSSTARASVANTHMGRGQPVVPWGIFGFGA